MLRRRLLVLVATLLAPVLLVFGYIWLRSDHSEVVEVGYGAHETMHVSPGEAFRFETWGLTWTFDPPSDPAVVRAVGGTVRHRLDRCMPDAPCGTSIAKFVALRPGTALVSATRSTCDSFIACNAETRSFAVEIVVDG